jgi:hypothetical protein
LRETVSTFSLGSVSITNTFAKDWWGLGFVIECNLPYLAISTHDRSDTRTLSQDKNLRARDDIDFLNLKSSTTPRDQQQRSCVPDNAVLHVAVFSLMITGRSEQHSTTVCLDDEFFDQESRLMSDEEIESLAGREDPITLQPEFKRARSPRAYLLVALEGQLERIVDHHANAQDRLKYSIELYVSCQIVQLLLSIEFLTQLHRIRFPKIDLLLWISGSSAFR